ncbi:hypothetical protein KBD68_00990 [Candidatus Woesebacteria bacterium]|jgi:hypothetical protein|nr:hypothetical protein [Candidatus Woesebacteria bacterium]
MKKLFWLSVSLIVLVSLIFASGALANEKKVPVPDKPELVMRTKLYPQFGFFIHDCGIRRVEADGNTTTKELGRNIWLDLVCVEKMYVVDQNRGYIVIEGQYRDTEWFMLTALDINGHIDFGRFITENGFDVTYVPNSPYVGDFYYTSKEGKKFHINVRGDLFGPSIEVK